MNIDAEKVIDKLLEQVRQLSLELALARALIDELEEENAECE